MTIINIWESPENNILSQCILVFLATLMSFYKDDFTVLCLGKRGFKDLMNCTQMLQTRGLNVHLQR